MSKKIRAILAVLAVIFILGALTLPAFAADEPQTVAAAEQAQEKEEDSSSSVTKTKALAAAIAISIAAAAGAASMAVSIAKASGAIARQPEAASDIRTNTMLGLVFIETAIIYALIVAIVIIFVL
jgi:F-type H+-transporting ATPase subunit c